MIRPRKRYSLLAAALAAACSAEGPTDVSPTPSAGKVAATTSPTVTATNPSATLRDTTLDVHVLGSGFDRGSRVDFLLDGIPDPKVRTNSSRYVNQGDLVANVTVAIDAVPDRYDVMVTTSRGKKGIGTERFEVLSLVDLGLLAGTNSYGRDVNSAGTVVGEYVIPKSVCKNAYAWTEATGAVDLPVPAGSCYSLAMGLNDAGTIVGTAWPAPGAPWLPFRWTPDGAGGYSREHLPIPSGYTGVDQMAIGAVGHIAAAFKYAPGLYDWFALSPGGTWQPVLKPAGACSDHYIFAINALGQMAGGDCTGALFWASPTTAPVRLPALGGSALAWDLDDSGTWLVGRARQVSGAQRAVRWAAEGEGWSLLDLGDLGGGESEARSINNQGEVTGWSKPTTGGNLLRAF